MGEIKGERPGFERDRKKDRCGRKRETWIVEKERESVTGVVEGERERQELEREKR